MCGEKGIPHCVNILPNKNELSPFAFHALQENRTLCPRLQCNIFRTFLGAGVRAAFKDEAAKNNRSKIQQITQNKLEKSF